MDVTGSSARDSPGPTPAGISGGALAGFSSRALTGAPVLDGLGVIAVIGRGGDSTVYRAHQASLDRDVAVKILDAMTDDDLRRFEREIRITVELGRLHPNIMKVLDARRLPDGRPCILMDFYELGSVHDRLLATGPLSVADVVAVGRVIGDALGFAHSRQVLHRDVKPQNILILPTSYVLADFGIARRMDSGHTSSMERLSYRHASPDVLDGREPEPCDDLWSLGSTLHTLLTGRAPFAADDPADDTALAYLRRVRLAARRPLPEATPRALAQIIERAMHPDRERRYHAAAEMTSDLAGLVRELDAWAPAVTQPAVPRPAGVATVSAGSAGAGSAGAGTAAAADPAAAPLANVAAARHPEPSAGTGRHAIAPVLDPTPPAAALPAPVAVPAAEPAVEPVPAAGPLPPPDLDAEDLAWAPHVPADPVSRPAEPMSDPEVAPGPRADLPTSGEPVAGAAPTADTGGIPVGDPSGTRPVMPSPAAMVDPGGRIAPSIAALQPTLAGPRAAPDGARDAAPTGLVAAPAGQGRATSPNQADSTRSGASRPRWWLILAAVAVVAASAVGTYLLVKPAPGPTPPAGTGGASSAQGAASPPAGTRPTGGASPSTTSPSAAPIPGGNLAIDYPDLRPTLKTVKLDGDRVTVRFSVTGSDVARVALIDVTHYDPARDTTPPPVLGFADAAAGIVAGTLPATDAADSTIGVMVVGYSADATRAGASEERRIDR